MFIIFQFNIKPGQYKKISPTTRFCNSMTGENPILVFLAVIVVLLVVTAVHASTTASCNRSCGSKTLPYPFGFSPSCDIRLNCTNGTAVVGEFPVQSVSSETVTLTITAKCNRSVQTLSKLFSKNYAPTSRNAILLQNCSEPMPPCTLPATIAVQTHFESPDCEANNNTNNISCYTGGKERAFMDQNIVTKRNCQYFVSSISAESFNDSALSLEVQVVELGWWLDGGCQCSDRANCSKLVAPATGQPSFRCRCNDGYEGDGYRAGTGCRKGQSRLLGNSFFNEYYFNCSLGDKDYYARP